MAYTTLAPGEKALYFNSDSFTYQILPSGESNYGLLDNTGIDDSNTYSGRLITGGNSGLLDLDLGRNPLLPATGTVNIIDDYGNLSGTFTATGLSIFRPQWTPSISRNVYNRSSLIDPDEEDPTASSRRSLSTSNQTSYPDFLFQEYIHYIAADGSTSLLDVSPQEVKTQVSISRNIRTATWSPYS